MKRSKMKLTVSALALSLAISTLSGCGGATKTSSSKVGSGEPVTFPLKTPITLKYWVKYGPLFTDPDAKASGKWELYEELEKRTGVKIQFVVPVQGQENENLNLLLASNDLPDMIENDLSTYSGGLLKAYQDGLVIDMTDLQKQYAPNLSKIYQTYPDILMDVQTEDGKFLYAPNIRGDESLMVNRGFVLRKDWLTELGLQPPTTIDEWHTVLTAFKEKKGAKSPFMGQTGDLHAFSSAFGMPMDDFYVENGKVVYRSVDSKYKEMVSTLAKWYKEGLIDPEFPTNTSQKILDSKVLTNQAGSLFTLLGGGIKRYINLAKDTNPKLDLVGTQYPGAKAGEPVPFIPHNGRINKGVSVVITSANKHPDISMAWLDYAYSKEGNMLFNFGIEGVSYNMVNGYPKFTDLIVKNPKGESMGVIGAKYTRSVNGAPFVQDPRYGEQYFDMPQQQEALKTWTKYSSEFTKANYRLRGQLTPEETSSTASQLTEITTYRDEQFLKWVMGQESVDTFDQYTAQMKKLGLDNVIKVRQDAYDRFMKKYPNANNLKDFNVADIYK